MKDGTATLVEDFNEKMVIQMPDTGPPIGSYVKVSRHGESLWLIVKAVNRRDQSLVGVVDNKPIYWPYDIGDGVSIKFDECIDWISDGDQVTPFKL